jgi:SAM-dependent methyltransferase
VSNGWDESAAAWIAEQGADGDFGRRYVLDPVMRPRAVAAAPSLTLDVGCGEGRFCRMLAARGLAVVGVDPTAALIAKARARDARGRYVRAPAEHLPFASEAFDLVVSYLALIDIPDLPAAVGEMVRVLRPGGTLLIANLTSFNTAGAEQGWVKSALGRRVHYPIDHYLDERAVWTAWGGIRILNYHRPMSTYLRLLLDAGLRLTYFDEPAPTADASPSRAASYRRVPYFLVMEWAKPARLTAGTGR